MPDIEIADATAGDAAGILALLRRVGLPTDDLEAHLGTALVARHDGEIVGSVALEVYGDGALLRSVAVHPDHRDRSLGRALVEAALARAVELALPAVYLLTTTAETYFPRFGFDSIPRDQVPASVQASIEFRSACPASAAVMRRILAAT